MQKESPIFVQTFDFMKWMMERTENFPKSQKFLPLVPKQELGNQRKKWFDERGQYEIGNSLYRLIFGNTPPGEIQPKNGHVEIRIVASDEHVSLLP